MAMELADALLVLAGLVAAGIIKGATGIGYSSCALPFLVAAVGLKPAVAMLVLPAMASNVMVVFSAGHIKSTVQQFWPLYFATLPGILFGISVLSTVDQDIATKVLGVLIVAQGIQSILQPHFRISDNVAQVLRVPVGLLNGFTGLTGSQVMPLMPYMLALNLGPQQFVQAVNLAVISASLFLGTCLMAVGMMQMNMLALSIAAIGPALLGVKLGTSCRARINDRQFRQLVVITLMGIGLMLIWR